MDELMNMFGTKVPKGKSSFSPLANGENSKGFPKSKQTISINQGKAIFRKR